MVQHDAETSEAEEMYLITIARAIEDGEAEPIPTSLVARELDVSGVSVNQMIRKLASGDSSHTSPIEASHSGTPGGLLRFPPSAVADCGVCSSPSSSASAPGVPMTWPAILST
jgi:hypothetical protein